MELSSVFVILVGLFAVGFCGCGGNGDGNSCPKNQVPSYCDDLGREELDLPRFLLQTQGQLKHIATTTEHERLCSKHSFARNQVLERNTGGKWISILQFIRYGVWKKSHISPVKKPELKKILKYKLDGKKGYVVTYICDCNGENAEAFDIYSTPEFSVRDILKVLRYSFPRLQRTLAFCKDERSY